MIEPADRHTADEHFEADLRAWAEVNLASYKRPRSYDFTSEIPQRATGKQFERKLRDPYWDGRAQI
ncbi:MAG: hypothetical protein OSA99_14765 [Acidimicrobiales bacterium]|nr:hypothetical protein [Acidimicrobiales bacterium]